jgi:RNase P/RNase MRP subunit POP5
MPVRGIRRRYLAVKVHSDKRIDGDNLFSAISEKILFLYGVVGSASMDFKPIEYQNGLAIISSNHLSIQQMRAVLAHIQEINKTKVSLQVLRVSGTIKTLKKKLKT